MPTSYITKSVKVTPDEHARIEDAMKRTGVLNFTEFVRRALDTEIRLSHLRERLRSGM